ncbi:SH3 domain-containing protein [Oribacterium sp. NK2B42]|uniref:SH3 domain-containing protein n=1 Tax=Oribacterium sp. NK2B42 TaxID=689781 RepID=UPI000417FD04|nr:SH3 domain-containing protein [Oribacterium sp. NK2B42]
MAEKIAVASERAAGNNHIGYFMGYRNDLLKKARLVGYDQGKVTEDTETDCSALVAVCVCYAGLPESAVFHDGNSFVTANMREYLKKTGYFEVLTANKYTRKEDYLKRGDILVSEGHHTVVNLTDGKYANAKTTSASTGKVEDAMNFNKDLAGKYTVTADALNMRLGAGKNKTVLKVLKKGAVVQNYGYYTSVSGTNWLLVKVGTDVGYCSLRYLARKCPLKARASSCRLFTNLPTSPPIITLEKRRREKRCISQKNIIKPLCL